MSNIPPVTIMVITYNRYDELKQVVDALIEHVSYPRDRLHLLVSDDSTGGAYLANFKRNKRYTKEFASVRTISTEKRSGWGANANNGLKHVMTNYIFQIEDDYVLTRPLDLLKGIALLEALPHVGMLRYRGTAGLRAIYHQFEADISGLYPEYRDKLGNVQGKATYFAVDYASQSLYACYSNGPHLKRLGFHTHYQLYPTGKPLGATEESYAINVKQRMRQKGAPVIAIMPDWIHMRFDHIGKSWKDTDHDVSE